MRTATSKYKFVMESVDDLGERVERMLPRQRGRSPSGLMVKRKKLRKDIP